MLRGGYIPYFIESHCGVHFIFCVTSLIFLAPWNLLFSLLTKNLKFSFLLCPTIPIVASMSRAGSKRKRYRKTSGLLRMLPEDHSSSGKRRFPLYRVLQTFPSIATTTTTNGLLEDPNVLPHQISVLFCLLMLILASPSECCPMPSV